MLRQNNLRQNNVLFPFTEGGHSCPPLREPADCRGMVAGVVASLVKAGFEAVRCPIP